VKALYAKKWSLLVANGRELGKIHGFALIVLGVMLFGLQGMLYMTPKHGRCSHPGYAAASRRTRGKSAV